MEKLLIERGWIHGFLGCCAM